MVILLLVQIYTSENTSISVTSGANLSENYASQEFSVDVSAGGSTARHSSLPESLHPSENADYSRISLDSSSCSSDSKFVDPPCIKILGFLRENSNTSKLGF